MSSFDGAPSRTRTDTPLQAGDFLTTIAFATIANDYVCELDYVMILPSIRFRPEPFSLYTFLFFNRLGSALVYIPLEAS